MKAKHTIIILLILCIVAACGQGAPEDQITASQLSEKMGNNEELVIVDVSEPDEYEAASIEGAKNIPIMGLDENFNKEIPNVEKDDEVILYCYSGMRSAIGVAKLKELGYTNVKTLKGGISNWQKEGMPVKQGK